MSIKRIFKMGLTSNYKTYIILDMCKQIYHYLLLSAIVLSCSSNDDTLPVVNVGFGEVQVFGTYRSVDLGWRSIDEKIMAGTLYLPLGEGSYTTVMFHFGSNEWSRQNIAFSLIQGWVNEGFAVLVYDKRGVGQSQGECCPWQDEGYFPLLAEDLVSGIRTLQGFPEVNTDAIGLYVFSQGGWVLPIAASILQNELAFGVIGSGTPVTLGEELLYSDLSGANACEPSNLSEEEIELQLDELGPSLFNPRPFLDVLTTPLFWVFGENDLSIPVNRSISIINDLANSQNKPFEYMVIPNANHSWVINGSICQSSGNFANPFPDIFAWIQLQLNE